MCARVEAMTVFLAWGTAPPVIVVAVVIVVVVVETLLLRPVL